MSTDNNDAPENEIPPIPVPTPEQSAPVPPVTPPEAPPVTGYTTAPVGAPPSPPPYGAVPTAPYGAAPAYFAPRPPQGLALASMITGIVGVAGSLLFLGLLPSIAAVITGHLAVKRQPYAKGLWLAGLITGYVGIFISAIYIAFWVIVTIIGISAGISGNRYGDF